MRRVRAMAMAMAMALALTGGVAACHDGPTYANQDPLAAESIAHDQIGGGKILFVGNATYLVDADARTTTVLNTGGASDFALSPDATMVAYKKWGGGDAFDAKSTAYDLFVSRIDGSGEVRIAAFQGNIEGSPSWSTNGADVVFANTFSQDTSPSVRPTIYRRAWSGPGNLFNLVTFPTGPDGLIECPTIWPWDRLSAAPSGEIAFTCGTRSLYVVTPEERPNGHGSVRLLFALPFDPLYARRLRSPAWSPDGTRIAYFDESTLAPNPPRENALRIIDVASGIITTVATVPFVTTELLAHGEGEWSICWRAGGARLLFTMPDGAFTSHLYAVPVSGGQPVRVTAKGDHDVNVSCAQ